MSCNSESRRAINYSLQEPINNKYDLWLSENLRYNSEGSLIYDSPGQPACDLILKIYKDGDWKPIAGLSTEHIVANKINIVDGVNYTYISPNDNALHTNNGFQLNHLPLFRNPDDSPNELFDAGTLGNAIYGFVTESEWNELFQTNWFTGAFNTSVIGGNSYNWGNLIQELISSGDIEIPLANTEEIGGIKADVHNHYTNAFKPVECKLYPNYGNWSSIHERLCINAHDVIDSIIESFSDPDENWLFGNHGITIGLQLGSNRIEWAIDGLGLANDGLYAKCKVIEGTNRHTVEWVDLADMYEVLGSDNSEDERYVVKGGGKEGTYLDYEGNWTQPGGTLYQAGNGIKFGDSNSINIDTTGAGTQGQVLSYDGDGGVEWVNPPSLIEGNNFNTFVYNNKIYIKSYTCIIPENEFVLDPEVSVSNTYSDSIYPFIDFTDYQVESLGGVSSITIENSGSPYLQYPSYMHFTTSAEKCLFTFPNSIKFVETESVNASSGEGYYYDDNNNNIIELKADTPYVVTFYKNYIKFETDSNSIFNVQFNQVI